MIVATFFLFNFLTHCLHGVFRIPCSMLMHAVIVCKFLLLIHFFFFNIFHGALLFKFDSMCVCVQRFITTLKCLWIDEREQEQRRHTHTCNAVNLFGKYLYVNYQSKCDCACFDIFHIYFNFKLICTRMFLLVLPYLSYFHCVLKMNIK